MKRTVPGLLLEIAQEILLCVCVGVSVRERENVCVVVEGLSVWTLAGHYIYTANLCCL